jgi:hypothetical protein
MNTSQAEKADFDGLLIEAKDLLIKLDTTRRPFHLTLPSHTEKSQWFILPQTCLQALAASTTNAL